MNNNVVYGAIAAIACVAMICTTVAGVMVDSIQAAAIVGGIAAIATPVIMGLLNKMQSDSRAESLSTKLDSQTHELKQEVKQATEKVVESITVPPK